MSAENKYKLSAGFRFGKTPLILSGEFGSHTASRLTAEIGDLTMVDIASYLIQLLDPKKGEFKAFPAPWDFLNKINFSGLKLIVEGKSDKNPNRVGISYPFSVDVGFAQITALELYYYPDTKKVSITPSGKFLGEEFKPWEIYPKQDAPKVPGYGSSLFDLKFLGLGQHLSVKDMVQSPGIADTITTLQTSFTEGAKIYPSAKAKPGDLIFSTSSGWMIGTRFIIINTVDLSIIYNDPYMYGLALSLSGAKAKTFAGLNVELLYKKVTDSIGVYSLHLKLPDAMRQLEFGAVSFTLPVIDIAIYSNGNFRVDLGFPNNNDWSRVATVQVFPFIGAGGFYFALLTGETATRLPSDYDPETGVFKPVIDFGIALRLGIGKTIDKGILKAGLSLCFQGIVTGTYGFFIPKIKGRTEDSYYYLNGQFEVVGRVYGEINFSIISARLDVMIYAAIGIVIEAYKDIILYVNAGVSLSLTVKINVGFTISVDLSFSTNISYTFTLPHGSTLPQWRKKDVKSLKDSSRTSNPFYTSLTSAPTPPALRHIKSKRMLRSTDKPVLNVLFLPQFSARVAKEKLSPEPKDQTASFIAGLFLDSGTDKNAGDFGILAKVYLKWLIDNCNEELKKTGFLAPDAEGVNADALNELYKFLAKDTSGVPVIAYRDLTNFLYNNFDVQVKSPMESHHTSLSEVEEDFQVSIFPMLPDLKMQAKMDEQAPFIDVDFSADPVDSSYNEKIQNYFAKLKVGYQNPLEAKNDTQKTMAEPVRQSLSTFIFQDYFILLGRNLVQDCIDLMEAYPYKTASTDSLASLCPAFEITAVALVNANANVVLKEGPVLFLGGTSYSIQKNDSFESIAAYYNFGKAGMVRAFLEFIAADKTNGAIINIFTPGSKIKTPGTETLYVCKTGDTLKSIADAAEFSVLDIIWENKDEKEILSTFIELSIPKYKYAIGERMTFTSFAALGKISLERFAENNATNDQAIFIEKTDLVLPQLHSLTSVDLLIDGITEKNSFRKLSGLASRYLMHGLRAPAPTEFKDKKEDTYALYELTKQLFDFPASAASSCTITLSENKKTIVNAEKWFKVVPTNPSQNSIQSKIILNAAELAKVGKLSTTLFQPNALSIKKAEGYTINPGRYMLKAPSVWQADAPVFLQGPSGSTWPGGPSGPADGGGWWPYSWKGSTGFSGPIGWQQAPTPKLWYFSDELTKAVQEEKALEPLFKLYMGRNNTVEKKFEKKEVSTFGWSTVIPLNINIVPSSLMQGQDLPTMFEIESTSEEGLQLLENLLINQYDPSLPPSERVDVAQVHILYTPAASSDGAGLRSIDPSEVISAVVQSNLSTVRNPQALRKAAGSVGRVFGSFNQDPVSNIKRLWEACSVRSGGFYLYYFDNNTKEGIPSNVFDEKGHAQISIVITYGLQHQYGHNFLNSMALGEAVPEDAYLFVESLPRKIVNLESDTTVEKLLKEYRLTLDQLAERLGDHRLKIKTVLEVRNIIFLLDSNEYTAEKIAEKFNAGVKEIRDLNPGIDFKQGDAVRIPPVKHTVSEENEVLNKIALKYSVSVIGLLWANREQPVFNDLSKLQLTDQSVNKTSSIVPGTVSFELLRKNPEGASLKNMTAENGAEEATPLDPESTLQLNYNLLAFAVKENPAFEKSSYSMPVSPGNAGWTGTTGASPFLNYQAVLPAFSYSKAPVQKGMPSYPAPEKNPYRGTGDIVQVNLDWQDMYGNRTVSPFNAPKLYPGNPYLNSFPQMIGYSDPLQSVLQWPSIGVDHLFLPKGDAASLDVSLTFDAASYQPAKGEAKQLIEKAQADLETYRKAIYQLSAKDVKATVSASPDPKLADTTELKPALLNMMDGIFHYLFAFSIPHYEYFEVSGTDAETLAADYRMSPEFIRALNPAVKTADVADKKSFLPDDNFYLYYTLAEESLTAIAAKLKITVEELREINPGVPEIPGNLGLIVIPRQRLKKYETTKAVTLVQTAREMGVSVAVLKAADPKLTDLIPAGKDILIPYFNSSIYNVQAGDTLTTLAAKFNVPVSVLNAVTCRHTWPLQEGTPILIPDNDFVQYIAKAGDTLSTIATEKWMAYETLCRINPSLSNDLPAGTAVLIAKTPVPLTQSFVVNFEKTLPPVFPLEVSLTISRQPEQVDESFLDQPEVRISKCIIPPHMSAAEANKKYRDAAPASETASLLHYANSFEKAFKDVKIATLGDKSASKNQLYAVRLHENGLSESKQTISYRFVKDNAVFYAPIPLATYPLSATFSVPQYVRGKGFTGHCKDSTTGCIGATGVGSLQMSFQGMQLDNVAANLFESVDQLLQPDLTRGLLQIDEFLGTACRQELLDAKKHIAEAYGNLVQPVLEGTETGAEKDASEALQQQMLQRLSNLYSIGTIVQLPVTVAAPHTERLSQIFGNPVTIKDADEKENSQVTFSSAQIKLQPADQAWMTFILNAVQPAKNKNLSVDLAYKPLAMEFNIHPIPGISDYKASQWLFFVKPLEEVPIGRIHVPVPLRDFPVPPTPLNQEAKGVNDEDTSVLTLEETRQWQYIFTFLNPDTAAAQDLIYSSTLFNIDNHNLRLAADIPDLFLGLATWSVVGRDMMSDLLKLLPTLQPGVSPDVLVLCRTLVKQYLSVVNYVALALPKWLQVRAAKYQPQQIKMGSKNNTKNAVEFLVIKPDDNNKEEDFYIQLQTPLETDTVSMPYPALPPINGRHYKPTIKAPSGKNSKQKYFFIDEDGKYLKVGEAKEDPKSDEISVIFGRYTNSKDKISFGEWLDIMDQWNAWGGVYVTRNQFLFEEGTQPTNQNFVYRTPVVRPYNASVPLLDYSTPFDIHKMKSPHDSDLLKDQLSNMLYNFFGEEDDTNPKVRLKLVWSYSYCINAEHTDPDDPFAQYVTLPGGLIPPFKFEIPGDWNTAAPDSFVCRLSAVITEWLNGNEVPRAEAGGRIQFDITAFSDLPENKLPFYRLRNLFLKMKDVTLK